MGLNKLYAGIRNAFIGAAALCAVSLGLDTILQNSNSKELPKKTGITRTAYAEGGLEEVTAVEYFQKIYENKYPVIVLRTGPDLNNEVSEFCTRMRKVIVQTQPAYTEPKVQFYAFKWEHFFTELKNFERIELYALFFYDERFHKGMSSRDTTADPSTFMYCRKDILTGKTYEKNHLIDILKGGPKSDESGKKWIRDLPLYWIDGNIYGKTNPDKRLYRFNNTGNYIDVGELK